MREVPYLLLPIPDEVLFLSAENLSDIFFQFPAYWDNYIPPNVHKPANDKANIYDDSRRKTE